MASVTKPGVNKRAPANSKHSPSNTSETGKTLRAMLSRALCSVRRPWLRNSQVPIKAVTMTMAMVLKTPSWPPISMKTAISTMGTVMKAMSIMIAMLAIWR